MMRITDSLELKEICSVGFLELLDEDDISTVVIIRSCAPSRSVHNFGLRIQYVVLLNLVHPEF